ncbi:hypothetical protein VPH49_17205 [Pseudomonas luteola]|uniref:hypothetical protein n=1 Tax=Pseudomonas luteola TaxID=47886 RepID=UPI003A87C250
MINVRLIEECCDIEPGLSFIKEGPAKELKEIYGNTTLSENHYIYIIKDQAPECDLWIIVLVGILNTHRKYDIPIDEFSLSERCQWHNLDTSLNLFKKLECEKEPPKSIANTILEFSKLLPSGYLSAKRALKIISEYYDHILSVIHEQHLYTQEKEETAQIARRLLEEASNTKNNKIKEILNPFILKLEKIVDIKLGKQADEDYLFILSTYCLWLSDQSFKKGMHNSALIFLHRACDTLVQKFGIEARIIKLVNKKPKFIIKEKSDYNVYLASILDLLPNSETCPYIFSTEDLGKIRKINSIRNECLMAHGENGIDDNQISLLTAEIKELFCRITGDRQWIRSAENFCPPTIKELYKILLDPECATPSYFKHSTLENKNPFIWNSID